MTDKKCEQEVTNCNYTEKETKKNFWTMIWSIGGGLILALIFYVVALHNSQFVTAEELKPLELQVQENRLHFEHISGSLKDIKEDLKFIKEKL